MNSMDQEYRESVLDILECAEIDDPLEILTAEDMQEFLMEHSIGYEESRSADHNTHYDYVKIPPYSTQSRSLSFRIPIPTFIKTFLPINKAANIEITFDATKMFKFLHVTGLRTSELVKIGDLTGGENNEDDHLIPEIKSTSEVKKYLKRRIEEEEYHTAMSEIIGSDEFNLYNKPEHIKSNNDFILKMVERHPSQFIHAHNCYD
ncbi:hypothetical protein P9112_010199 [Eukaryota sp. TZLM1-RC]